MKSNFLQKPLLVVPAIPKEGGIKFIMPRSVFSLDEDIALQSWTILEFCNGVNTIDDITEQLKDRIDPVFISGFLSDLNSLGIIVDSRRIYMHFHAISGNPTVYGSGITSDEIVTHTKSSRPLVKSGTVFTFQQNVQSKVFNLQQLRKSCRGFSSELISIDEIGGLLDIGYSYARHAVPSAGGLYPMKIYAIVHENQKDFPAGYYEYDNENNCLVLFNQYPDKQRTLYAFNDIRMPFDAPIVMIIAADVDRQTRKYSNIGYRFMAIEAGEIAQNISLASSEFGLSSCQLGGLLENVISEELGMEDCLPFLGIAIGKKADYEHENIWMRTDEFERLYVGDDKQVRSVWLLDEYLCDNFGKSYFQFFAQSANNQISSGISTSWADAKLKAIAEAYERQCASNVRWDIISSADKIKGGWVDPRIFAPLSDCQYSSLKHLQKFHEALELEWVSGLDFNGNPILVPIDMVFYPISSVGRKLIIDTCSSGFAAFTDYDNAVKRGLLELVERDSLMRSWYEKTSPRILSYDILPVHLRNRVDFWKSNGRDVIFLDVSQNGVIVIETIIKSDSYPCFVSGASSSLDDFNSTAIKAFQEAESRLIYGLNEENRRVIEPSDVKNVLDHELLYTQSRKFHKHIEFLWAGEKTDKVPEASISFSKLKKCMEIVIVDVSIENLPLYVVKVISPKLIPINFGYGTEHYEHGSLDKNIIIETNFPHYFA
jgi:thiazole/oxazole-forming peptide maturase SagD family component